MIQLVMTNTGKPSEAQFENRLMSKYGKGCYIHRFEDAQTLHGMNGKAVKCPEQPADYLVCISGVTFLAEVKSTGNKTSFPFALIKTNQFAAAKLIKAAGGLYYFYVHSLDRDEWYVLTLAQIQNAMKAGRQSLRWDDMEKWDY